MTLSIVLFFIFGDWTLSPSSDKIPIDRGSPCPEPEDGESPGSETLLYIKKTMNNIHNSITELNWFVIGFDEGFNDHVTNLRFS
jgi:hypothetical protein